MISNGSANPTELNATEMLRPQVASIREVYPSLNEPEGSVFVLTSIFLTFFVVGVCGNASTLSLIFGCGTPRRRRKRRTSIRGPLRHAHWYLVGLSCVDILMLLGLPGSMIDSLIGFWIFNSTFCKFHYFCNTVGRITSPLIITAMSVDTYFRLLRPKLDVISRKVLIVIIASFCFISAALLFPILFHAEAQRVFLFESTRKDGTILHVRIFKCVDGMPINNLLVLTGLTFIFGYLLPVLAIACINTRSIACLKSRSTQTEHTARHVKMMKRLTAYVVLISTVCFGCWTPYWASVLYVGYADLFQPKDVKSPENSAEPTAFLLYSAHIFPYVNAAINWILYSRMHSQLALTFPTANDLPPDSTTNAYVLCESAAVYSRPMELSCNNIVALREENFVRETNDVHLGIPYNKELNSELKSLMNHQTKLVTTEETMFL